MFCLLKYLDLFIPLYLEVFFLWTWAHKCLVYTYLVLLDLLAKLLSLLVCSDLYLFWLIFAVWYENSCSCFFSFPISLVHLFLNFHLVCVCLWLWSMFLADNRLLYLAFCRLIGELSLFTFRVMTESHLLIHVFL
jgi:hypothetical protein